MSGIQRQTVTAILIVTIGEELSTPKKKSPMESKGVIVMTDKERQEDEKLKKCLQTAYGATDEQLLMELEEAEASLDASEFPGAEERMFRRFMEMEREEREKREKENLSEDAVQDNMAVPGMDTAGGGMGADGTDKNKKKIRKFGKKKVFLVAALVAVFVGALGVTAVGEKNYFFRGWKGNVDDLIFNNDKNKVEMSQLEEAYIRINEELDITMVKLGYVPSNLVLRDLIISQNRAVLQFEYNGGKVYFVQGKKDKSSSVIVKSDRKRETKKVVNEWINQKIEIKENQLGKTETEYEAKFYYEDTYYLLSGKIPQEEFEKIVKNIICIKLYMSF